MPFDRYMPCPCGTGKKVKFCCEDLLSELEAIQKMLEGEQRLACLEYIDKLLETHPDRACLLAIKILVHYEMQQNEPLEKTLQHFEEKHPENPIAAAERARSARILAARRPDRDVRRHRLGQRIDDGRC